MPIERRNACPSLAAPMRTGDGWLARLPPLLAAPTPAQMAGIAAAALRHGNGLVEISKRGNLQIRGLDGPAAAIPLAADLAASGLDLPEGLPISADPLASLAAGGTEAAAIARLIHEGIETVGFRLAPKLAIIADLGAPLGLEKVSADIRLRIEGRLAHIGLGGSDAAARWIGAVPRRDAGEAVLAILSRLSAIGPTARLAGPDGYRDDSVFIEALDGRIVPARPAPRQVATAPVGPLPDRSTALHGIAFPFGQARAGDLAALAEAAASSGLAALAPAPERVLLLAGEEGAVAATLAEARRLGFITKADDPRRFVSACIGSAGCASGAIAGRDIAARLPELAGALLDGSIELHLAGCAKGCAHPDAAVLNVVGTAAASASVDKDALFVLEGRARDAGCGIAPAKQVEAGLARLADEIARQRRPGEAARSVLSRMGQAAAARLLTGFEQDGPAADGFEPRRAGEGHGGAARRRA